MQDQAQQSETGTAKAPRRRVYVRKTDIVLEAAERAFLSAGYAATSMDAIADLANVSKRTVYSNFGSKQDLFAAVIRKRCAAAVPQEPDQGSLATNDPEQVLIELGTAFLTNIFSRVQVELYQTVVAEARQFPELGKIMLDGPIMQTQRIFEMFLQQQVKLGHLALPDPAAAAAQLISMLKGNWHMRLLFNQPLTFTKRQIRDWVTATVHRFMQGARSPA